MWIYEKKLEFPVHIKEPNPKLAQLIISQYGGPDGEAGASFRYLSQRYSMKDRRVAGVLTDVGTEELAHLEIVGAMVHQLTRDLTPEEIEKSGFAPYYVDHTLGVWPQAAGVLSTLGKRLSSDLPTIAEISSFMSVSLLFFVITNAPSLRTDI